MLIRCLFRLCGVPIGAHFRAEQWQHRLSDAGTGSRVGAVQFQIMPSPCPAGDGIEIELSIRAAEVRVAAVPVSAVVANEASKHRLLAGKSLVIEAEKAIMLPSLEPVGIEGADLSEPTVTEGGVDIEVTVDMITAQVRAMHERELRPVPLGDLLIDEPILCATQKEEVQIEISRTFYTALSAVRCPPPPSAASPLLH